MSDAIVRVFDLEDEADDFDLLMKDDGYQTKKSGKMELVRLRYEAGAKAVEVKITGDGSNFVVMAWRA
jgi:hypothetical protein